MLKKLIATLAALLAAAYVWLAFVGIDPQDRRPGTKLSGVATQLPDNWRVLDDVQEVHLETHPWYGIPFSVTVVIAPDPTGLYLPSIYETAQPFPGSKYWNKVVAENPNVRLRVNDALYEMHVEPMTDPESYDIGLRALARKYPFWQQRLDTANTDRDFAILRLSPRRI
ncbi:MAG: hypothetical protein ACR2PZ_23490 [Pseudomonadales bacterium]